MNFKGLLLSYNLGNLSEKDLPSIAFKGLEEGFDSPSLVILAGIDKNESYFIISDYYNRMLDELKINLPDKRKSALEYALIILKNTTIDEANVINVITKIKNEAIDRFNFFDESIKYCYDSIGFEKIYGLFDDIEDIKERATNIIKTDLEEQTLDLKHHIIEELKKWEKQLEQMIYK